jgi:hypothetical protein
MKSLSLGRPKAGARFLEPRPADEAGTKSRQLGRDEAGVNDAMHALDELDLKSTGILDVGTRRKQAHGNIEPLRYVVF